MNLEWLKSLGDLLRSWPGAFALSFGGATVIGARIWGQLATDIEFLIGFVAASAAWMLVAIFGRWVLRKFAAILRAKKLKAREEAATQAQTAAREHALERAVANITELHDWEVEALYWIYHRGGRARASIHHTGISGLIRLNILEPEERRGIEWTDTVFVITETVRKTLEGRLGPGDKNKARDRPPWERRSRWP